MGRSATSTLAAVFPSQTTFVTYENQIIPQGESPAPRYELSSEHIKARANIPTSPETFSSVVLVPASIVFSVYICSGEQRSRGPRRVVTVIMQRIMYRPSLACHIYRGVGTVSATGSVMATASGSI